MKYKLSFIGQKKDVSMKFKNSFEAIAPYYTRSGRIYTGLEGADIERIAKKTGLSVLELSTPPLNGSADSQQGSFWKMFAVRVPNDGLPLDTEKPYDELIVCFLKKHHLVAQGWEHKLGHHKFVLVDDEHEAKIKTKKNRVRLDALSYFGKMEVDEMRKCMQAFGKAGALTSSALIIERDMMEVVEENPQKFMDLWVNNIDKEDLAWIEDAVFLRIVTKKRNHYYYGADMIADSQTSAIAWKKNVKNIDVVKVIDKEIKAKKKLK